MITTEQDIAQFIVSTVTSSPNIPGALLGSKIKRQFPGVFYGKLTEFINRNCANAVVSIGQVNLDNIWALRSSANPPPRQTLQNIPAPPKSETLNEIDGESLTAWKVFARFDTQAKLAVNPASAQIKVVQLYDEVVAPFIEITSITQTEYQNIAIDFVKQLPEPDRQYFRKLAEGDSFQSRWYDVITTWQHGLYAKTWGTFRFEAICAFFIRRLVAKGVEENLVDACVESLKRIKAKRAKEKEVPLGKSPNIRTLQPYSNVSIQELVIGIIKSLSEDELRRIWLPVGAVLDATRK
jgi:hypothetical protein